MCLNPKWIYKKGKYKEDNYNGLKDDSYEIGIYAKCGVCEQCQNEKSNSWVVRNYYESKKWNKIAFITLTYKDNPFFLVKKDGQLFMKRLRRRIEYEFEKTHKAIKGTELYKQLKREFNEENGIRMFMVGEYGTGRTKRPHLHYIIYNLEDIEKKYLDINKKGNILYKSELINKAWRLGRTSYQEFTTAEIPYISLYETPKETFKRAYKMTLDKAKKLEKNAHRFFSNSKQRKYWQEALKGIIKKMKKEKEKYYAIKEYNTWSQTIGFDKFYEEYSKSNENTWTVWIEDCEFLIPTSWVKKLANLGHMDAIEEMKRRQEESPIPSPNEEIEKNKNFFKLRKKGEKIIEWIEEKQKDEVEEL